MMVWIVVRAMGIALVFILGLVYMVCLPIMIGEHSAPLIVLACFYVYRAKR